MLDTWFKHLGGRIKDPGAFSVPPTMAEPVLQAAQHFWEVAQAEARRDLDNRVRDGLAAATANVEAEKEKAAIADAAAFSANVRATSLQNQLDELLTTLETERIQHATVATKAVLSAQRCEALQAEVLAAQQTTTAERVRADQSISMADERATGAERRAALEIERERHARAKAEKMAESIAKRFEAALKAEVNANGLLTAAEDRLAQLRLDVRRREEEWQVTTSRLEMRVRELEASLSEAHQVLSRSAMPEALAEEILAKLQNAAEPRDHAGHRGTPVRPRRKKART